MRIDLLECNGRTGLVCDIGLLAALGQDGLESDHAFDVVARPGHEARIGRGVDGDVEPELGGAFDDALRKEAGGGAGVFG